jgi:hypothetical protein
MDRQRVDEIMTLLATIDAHGPLIVNANEGEYGERVQVYIIIPLQRYVEDRNDKR